MQNVLDKFNMKGRTVLVTGGAGLLGRQFALALAQAGADVMLADLAYEAAADQAEVIRAEGLSAEALAVDVIDPDSTCEMVQQTLARFGRLDVLINSAALDPKFDPQHQSEQAANAFETYSLDAWRKALDVNLTGSREANVSARPRRDHQYLLNLWLERPRPAHLYPSGWYTLLQTGILLGHQSRCARLYALLSCLLCWQEHPRERSDARRRV